jgi:hypothetical protein
VIANIKRNFQLSVWMGQHAKRNCEEQRNIKGDTAHTDKRILSTATLCKWDGGSLLHLLTALLVTSWVIDYLSLFSWLVHVCISICVNYI